MRPVDGRIGVLERKRCFYESKEGCPIWDFERLLGNSVKSHQRNHRENCDRRQRRHAKSYWESR